MKGGTRFSCQVYSFHSRFERLRGSAFPRSFAVSGSFPFVSVSPAIHGKRETKHNFRAGIFL